MTHMTSMISAVLRSVDVGVRFFIQEANRLSEVAVESVNGLIVGDCDLEKESACSAVVLFDHIDLGYTVLMVLGMIVMHGCRRKVSEVVQ
eukprot:13690754-Ditylum_brightwellii.AAC.1